MTATAAGSRQVKPSSAARRSTDYTIVVVAVLLLLSTVEGFGWARGPVVSAATLDPLAVFKLVVRGVALFASFYLLWRSPGSVRALWATPNLWFICFFVFAALTGFISVNPFVSVSRALSFVIVLIFACAVAATYLRQGRELVFWRGFFVVLLATSIPLLASTVWIGPVLETYDYYARLGGVFQSNHLGLFAGVVIVTCVLCLMRRTLIALAVCALPLAVYVALFALSRSAWIAITVGLLVAALTVKGLRAWIPLLSALGIVAVLLGLEMGVIEPDNALVTDIRRGQTGTELASGTGRTGLYSYLLDTQFPKRPLLGFGFQMLSQEDVAADPSPSQTAIARELGWPALEAHNLFLHTLIGTGLVGLGLFLVAIGSLLRRTIGDYRAGDPIARDQLVLLAIVLTHAMMDTTLVTGIDHAFLVVSAIVGLQSARRSLGLGYAVRAARATVQARPSSWPHLAGGLQRR